VRTARNRRFRGTAAADQAFRLADEAPNPLLELAPARLRRPKGPRIGPLAAVTTSALTLRAAESAYVEQQRGIPLGRGQAHSRWPRRPKLRRVTEKPLFGPDDSRIVDGLRDPEKAGLSSAWGSG